MHADREFAAAVEALLFVSDEPVSAARIAKVTESDEETALGTLRALAEEYRRDERGFQLREAAGGWRLYTHPAHHDVVERYVLSWDTRRLSQAALEALAVIAYHQPVTRAGVNAVRGVNSETVISSLLEKGLVREAGRDRAAGNAILYVTTKSFLEKFGLRGLDELPPLHEFAVDERTESELRERLGGRFARLGGDADDTAARDDDDDIAEID